MVEIIALLYQELCLEEFVIRVLLCIVHIVFVYVCMYVQYLVVLGTFVLGVRFGLF